MPEKQSQAIEQSSFQDNLTSVNTVQVVKEADTSEETSNEETFVEEVTDTSEQPSNEELPSAEI